MELPGTHPLKDAHQELHDAVKFTYGMTKQQNPLEFLMELNTEIWEAEQAGEVVQGPGLPACIQSHQDFVSGDVLVSSAE